MASGRGSAHPIASHSSYQTDPFESVDGRAEEQRYLWPMGHGGSGVQGRQVDHAIRQDDAQADGHRDVGGRRQGGDEFQIPYHRARHNRHQREYHVDVNVQHCPVFVAELKRQKKNIHNLFAYNAKMYLSTM